MAPPGVEEAHHWPAASQADDAETHPLERVKHPGLNDVMFGRGGDTNYHIGNHRFRVLADEYRDQYRSASRKEKAAVVQEVVRLWRDKKPPGRFLTRTQPEKGDESLWHDVGEAQALKKAAKILSEKAPPKDPNQDETTNSRKRLPPPNALETERPTKEAHAGNNATQPSAAATVSLSGAVSATGAGAFSLHRPHNATQPPAAATVPLSGAVSATGAGAFSLHRPQLPMNAASPPPPPELPLIQQLLAIQSLRQSILNIRDLHGVLDYLPFLGAWPTTATTRAFAAAAASTRRPVQVVADYDLSRLAMFAHLIAQRESTGVQSRMLFDNGFLMNNLLNSVAHSRFSSANPGQGQMLALTPDQLQELVTASSLPSSNTTVDWDGSQNNSQR